MAVSYLKTIKGREVRVLDYPKEWNCKIKYRTEKDKKEWWAVRYCVVGTEIFHGFKTEKQADDFIKELKKHDKF